jgi:hypothetical protein
MVMRLIRCFMKKLKTLGQVVSCAVPLLASFWISGCAEPVSNPSFFRRSQAVISANPTPGHARVTKVTDAAWITSHSGPNMPLKPGMAIGAGDLITTSGSALVELEFGPHSHQLVVKPRSAIRINQLDFVTNGLSHSQFEFVGDGEMSVRTRKRIAGSVYEVKHLNSRAVFEHASCTIYSDGWASVFEGSLTITYTINGIPSQPAVVEKGDSIAPPTVPGGKAIGFLTPPSIPIFD